jgi:Histidine kinase-, DNA gyrase B-, and HSP90-like ATPase
MKYVNAPPGARRLIESLRSLGYDCATAIADLIDNSITARASEVHIQIAARDATCPPFILIADNGRGMDRESLHEAMRFGSYQEYTAEDLGKYGLGLKTASLSQCRRLTVVSKPHASAGTRPRRHLARWDLDYVNETDDWNLLLPEVEDLEEWELQVLSAEVCRSGGTAILWTGLEEALPLLAHHDVRRRERYLATLMAQVAGHLRMVFHRFMDGSVTDRRRLHLYLAGNELEPWDPFCQREKTRELDVRKLPVSLAVSPDEEVTGSITIRAFVLPKEDEFSSQAAWHDAAGPRQWNQQQGFYFYRNDRLLQAGGWSRLRAPDEHTKLLRVAVHFPKLLDRAFEINITKMRARFPADLRDVVRADVSKWAKTARDRYDRGSLRRPGAPFPQRPQPAESVPKPAADRPHVVTYGGLSFTLSNAPNHSLTVSNGAKPGHIRIVVPQSHEVAAIFDIESSEDGEVRRLAAALMGVLEAVYERRLRPDAIPIEALRRALRRFTP